MSASLNSLPEHTDAAFARQPILFTLAENPRERIRALSILPSSSKFGLLKGSLRCRESLAFEAGGHLTSSGKFQFKPFINRSAYHE
ncbi:hypothetical protein LMG29542_07730 [Paraburkholderia humisilvae]|uniref:Uncharacterized protein n=1 Tax=Paraburkholderia humisilvae TaxID=627669 RepID=A0A6J5FA77_9BURK|nr:hypothetical protein LMG29542_07730 [Paraburkholderia humisilvae]